MASLLPQELRDLVDGRQATAALATLDDQGFPHAVSGIPLRLDEAGNLLYLEYLESSASNRNLVRSIWFDRKVAVAFSTEDGRSFQVKGRPTRAHITGPVFLKYYREVREAEGDVNLAAVWVIEPDEVIEETLAARRRDEEAGRPFFTHLDRLVR